MRRGCKLGGKLLRVSMLMQRKKKLTMDGHRCTRMKAVAGAAIALVIITTGALSQAPALKTERFDQDPGWEGFNNRVQPTHTPTVVQDFGFRPVKAGGRSESAIGGRVTRSS